MKASAGSRKATFLLIALAFLLGFGLSRGIRERGPLAWAGGDGGECVTGDLNGDRSLDVSDAIWILLHIFSSGPPPVPCPQEDAAISTVVLVRHGERDAAPDSCPDSCPTECINAQGLARADRLADVVEDLGVDHLIASDRCRTRQTLEPTSARLGDLPIEEIASPEDVAARVLGFPQGTTSVVAHHSFTIHDILEALGLDDVRTIPVGGSSYDNLLVVLLPPDAPSRLLRFHY